MQNTGRIFAVGVVGLFNVMRYFYYHQYLGMPFKANFFILTTIFVAIAWWGGKQFDRAKYYSEKDPLTDTYNRRTVEQIFLRLASLSDRQQEKLGVIMVDLDDFKEVNDTYGHHKGDELLIHFAALLKRCVGKNGLVARWGGDEFIILVPGIDKDFELNYVKNVQSEVQENLSFTHSTIGASIGYAIYPNDGKSFIELLQEADRAMYKNKARKKEA